MLYKLVPAPLRYILPKHSGLHGAVFSVVLLPSTPRFAADEDPRTLAGRIHVRALVCVRAALALLGLPS